MQAPGSSTTETAEAHAQKLEAVTSLLRTAGAVRLKALGTSMLPTIWPGDILVIATTPHQKLVCGNLIAVCTRDRIRVHRLLSKAGLHWITRGDSMPQNDPPIAPADVMGTVFEIWRARRRIIPQTRLRLLARGLAWLLSFSMICRIALRLRSVWIHRMRHANASQLCSHEPVS